MQLRAAEAGHADCVCLLRDHVATLAVHLVAATFEEGELAGHTALSVAARNGHFHTVACLLADEPAADVHGGPYYGAALIEAAENGHGHVVDLLLQHGCEPDCHVETDRPSALLTAASNQQWPICTVRIVAPCRAVCLPSLRTRRLRTPARLQLLAAYGASMEGIEDGAVLREVLVYAVFLDLVDALHAGLARCRHLAVDVDAPLSQGAPPSTRSCAAIVCPCVCPCTGPRSRLGSAVQVARS